MENLTINISYIWCCYKLKRMTVLTTLAPKNIEKEANNQVSPHQHTNTEKNSTIKIRLSVQHLSFFLLHIIQLYEDHRKWVATPREAAFQQRRLFIS